jgi:hypothetical protein
VPINKRAVGTKVGLNIRLGRGSEREGKQAKGKKFHVQLQGVMMLLSGRLPAVNESSGS